MSPTTVGARDSSVDTVFCRVTYLQQAHSGDTTLPYAIRGQLMIKTFL